MARSKNHRIAKRTKQQRYCRETGGWIGADVPIYQESSGELRFFLMLPDWLVDTLGHSTLTGEYRHEITFVQKSDQFQANCLFGRDPAVLLEAEHRLHRRYEKEFAAATAEHFIVVDIEGVVPGDHFVQNGPSRHRFGDVHQIELRLSTVRRARVLTHWHEVRSDGTVGARVYNTPEGTMLPYTPDLWERLSEMKERLGKSITRLVDLLADAEQLPLALAAADALLSLPDNRETPQ